MAKKIEGMIDRFIMWLLHLRYKKYGMPIFYIKGPEKIFQNIFFILKMQNCITGWKDSNNYIK